MARAPASAALLLILAASCSPSTNSDADADVDADADADADADTGPDADPDDGPTPCDDSDDCDDGIDCTRDVCAVGGVCDSLAMDDQCPGDQVCRVGRGCVDPSECESPADCDDGVFCNGAEQCVNNTCFSDPGGRDCDDNDDCTSDSCNTATDQCAHSPLPGCVPDADVDGGPDPFDPEVHYAGAFDVFGIPVSDCLAASFNIRTVTFTSTPDLLTVQAGSFPLTQAPRPAGATFDASYVQGGCGTYRLTGEFINSNTFSGRWTAVFSGGCSICGGQDAAVTGVRSP